MSRIESIRKLLEHTPDDTLLVYSLGMELLSANQPAEALRQFSRVLELDAGYLAAYQQLARAHQLLGRRAEAAEWLRKGIALAQQTNQRHAADRMKLLLDALSCVQ